MPDGVMVSSDKAMLDHTTQEQSIFEMQNNADGRMGDSPKDGGMRFAFPLYDSLLEHTVRVAHKLFLLCNYQPGGK